MKVLNLMNLSDKFFDFPIIRAVPEASFIWLPSDGPPCPMLKINFIHRAFPSFPCYWKVSPLGFEVGGYFSKEVPLAENQRIPTDYPTVPTEIQKNSDILELHTVGKGLMYGLAVSSLFFLFYEDKQNKPSYFCNIPIPDNYNANVPYPKYFNFCFLLPVASLPKAVGETFLVKLNKKTKIPLEILFLNYVRCYTILKKLSTTALFLSLTLLVYPIIYPIARNTIPIVLKQYGLFNKVFCYILELVVTTLVSGTVMNSVSVAFIWVLPRFSAVLLHLPVSLLNLSGIDIENK